MYIVEKVVKYQVRNKKTYSIVVTELFDEIAAEKAAAALNAQEAEYDEKLAAIAKPNNVLA